MRSWQLIAGVTVWMLVALTAASTVLQPMVDLACAFASDDVSLMAVCADGSSNLLMGCASSYL